MPQAAETDVMDDEANLEVDPPEDEAEGSANDEADTGDDEAGTDDADSEGGETDEDDGVVVSLGEESPASEDEHGKGPAPPWVKALRKEREELHRENRRLRDALKTRAADEPSEQEIKVGEKPTLAACEYDEEKFDRDLLAWHQRKQDAEAKKREKEAAEKKAADDWQAKVSAYNAAKVATKVRGYDEAEEWFKSTFSPTQQGIVLAGPDEPATAVKFVAALHNSPKVAGVLAAIKDPVKFTYALARLEASLKTTTKKTAPVPERVVRGSAPVTSGNADAQLEKLRAEATKTGDMTKVLAYKRALRARGK